jgi:hypothetical protein
MNIDGNTTCCHSWRPVGIRCDICVLPHCQPRNSVHSKASSRTQRLVTGWARTKTLTMSESFRLDAVVPFPKAVLSTELVDLGKLGLVDLVTLRTNNFRCSTEFSQWHSAVTINTVIIPCSELGNYPSSEHCDDEVCSACLYASCCCCASCTVLMRAVSCCALCCVDPAILCCVVKLICWLLCGAPSSRAHRYVVCEVLGCVACCGVAVMWWSNTPVRDTIACISCPLKPLTSCSQIDWIDTHSGGNHAYCCTAWFLAGRMMNLLGRSSRARLTRDVLTLWIVTDANENAQNHKPEAECWA